MFCSIGSRVQSLLHNGIIYRSRKVYNTGPRKYCIIVSFSISNPPPPPCLLERAYYYGEIHTKVFFSNFVIESHFLINILVRHVHVKMILNPKLFNHPINCFKKFFFRTKCVGGMGRGNSCTPLSMELSIIL